MLTMEPRPARFMERRPYLEHSHAPLRSTAKTRSQSAWLISVASKYALMPALLTRMSTVPCRAATPSMAFCTSGSEVMSARTNSTDRPAADTSAAVARPTSASRSAKVTSAPSAANFSTMARPMPCAPPVTNAIFRSRRPIRLDAVILYGSVRLYLTLTILACACGACSAPAPKSEPPPEKKDEKIHTLTNANGVEVRTIPYGAIITSIKVPDRNGHLDDVVLGFDTPDEYAAK